MDARAAALEPRSQLRGLRRPFALAPTLVTLVGAAIAVAIQSLWIPIDADVSWLLTVCDRVLSGDRLYIDIIEVNPPASVWLYLPLVAVARAIGARPETVVVAAFVAGAFASVATSVRLATGPGESARQFWLTAALSFITLVLPMALFAQREHAALLLALPSLAVMARIAEGRPPGRAAVFAGGIAAGLIVVIKPYFVPAILAPALWAAWKRRSLVPLLPGAVAAGATVVAYALAVVAFAGAYFDLLPVIAHTYAPMHDKIWKVLVGPALYPALCLVLALLARARPIPPLAIAWALGAVGFLGAAFIQGKNYPNHWLPQAGLALAATMVVLQQPGIESARRRALVAAVAIVGLLQAYHWVILPDPAVAAAVERIAPQRPKIIALSPELTIGHPVTRNVGGEWAGSRAGLFTAAGARYVGLKDPLAQSAYREDIQSFASDVRRNSPDVVLVDTRSKKWLMREPEIAQAMQGFRPAAGAENVEVWVRRAPAR